jgi:FlaA1/EpsC-like NDP-sugar epimerase
MIPLCLWGAIALKHGALLPIIVDWRLLVIVLMISIPIFARCGLYRAVIRFLGHKAAFAVVIAVGTSAVLLAITSKWAQIPGLSLSVVVIYSSLALIYVAGSRVLDITC